MSRKRRKGKNREVDEKKISKMKLKEEGEKKHSEIELTSIVADFKKLKVIGQGQYAKVFLVQQAQSKKFYAMKALKKRKVIDSDQVEHTKTERAVLEVFKHPFIVNLHYAFQSRRRLFMVMDFVNGGELFYHLKRERRISEDRVRFYAAELFLALDFLHQHDIVYRDLKPENILLSRDGHVILTDFGLAKVLRGEEDRTNTFCGSPEYLPPEVLLNELDDTGYSKAVDWWAYGVLVYEMLVGVPPFYSENVQEMYQQILYSDLYFPEQLGISKQAKDLISRLLIRNPEKRLGSNTRNDIKDHPYFDGISFKNALKKRYRPPFVPKIKSDDDVSYVDEEFLKMPLDDSDDEEDEVEDHEQENFESFSYDENAGSPVHTYSKDHL